MARGYLQRIAHRAVEGTAGTLRPRRLVRATAPLDEPMPAARMPAARTAAEHATTAVESIVAPSAASAPPHEQPHAAPPGELGEPHAAPPPSAPAPAITPSPAAVIATPAATRANARRDLVRRNVTVAPDPLAVALAAAVRWTSADEHAERARLPGLPERAALAHPAERTAPSVAPSAAAAILRADERERAPHAAPAQPPTMRGPNDRSARDTPAPRATPAPRPAPTASAVAHARPAAAAPPPQRFTEIHIGSVDVQIVPEPPAPPPPRAATAPAAAPSGPLARGLTSRFALRQS